MASASKMRARLALPMPELFLLSERKWINVFEEEEKHDFLDLKLFFTDIFLQTQPPQQLTFQFYY